MKTWLGSAYNGPCRPVLTGQPGLGVLVLKVVEREIGGTTASEFHCSGSWPA